MESFSSRGGHFLYSDESEGSSSDTRRSPTSNDLVDCPYCYEEFTTVEEMRLHKPVHGKNKHYLCKLCGASFVTSVGWQYHYRRHNSELQFSCDSCDLKFCGLQALVKHIETHKYFCSSCDKTFAKRKQCRMHEKSVHNIIHDDCESDLPEVYRCRKCHVNFRLFGQLRDHMMESKPCRPFSCDRCGKGFFSLIHLQSHMSFYKNCHQVEENRKRKKRGEFSEVETDRRVDRSYERTAYHIEEPRPCKEPAHHTEERKSYVCNSCDLRFPKIHLRRNHWIRYKHCRPYWCGHCDAKFFRKDDLNIHLKNHSYKCQSCARRFFHKDHFDLHGCNSKKKNSTDEVFSTEKAFHTDRVDIHGCKRLKKNFTDEVNLSGMNFECQYCFEIYVTEEDLQDHIDYVSKYLFICPKCSDTFKNVCTFGYHLMTVHGIDKMNVGRFF